MLTSEELAAIRESLAALAAQPSGRLRLERVQYDPHLEGSDVQTTDLAFDEEAGSLALDRQRRSSLLLPSASNHELLVFLDSGEAFRRTAFVWGEDIGEVLVKIGDSGEPGQPQEPGTEPPEERWSPEPISPQAAERLRAHAGRVRDLTLFEALLADPDTDSSRLPDPPGFPGALAASPERGFVLSTSAHALVGQTFGGVDLLVEPARQDEALEFQLWLDPQRPRLRRAVLDLTGFWGQTRQRDSLSLLAESLKTPIARPAPDERLPNIAPLAGHVSQVAAFQFYELRLALPDFCLDLPVLWRPQYGFALHLPRVGESLLLSGVYRFFDVELGEMRPSGVHQRRCRNLRLGTLRSEKGYVVDMARGWDPLTPAPELSPGDLDIFFGLQGAMGAPYIEAFEWPSDQAFSRDERGLGHFWPDSEILEATVEEVRPRKVNRWLNLQADDGEEFSGPSLLPGPANGDEPVKSGEAVTIFRGWSDGQMVLRWAQDRQGQMILGSDEIEEI